MLKKHAAKLRETNLVLYFGTKSTVPTESIPFNTSNFKPNRELNCWIIAVRSAALGQPSNRQRSIMDPSAIYKFKRDARGKRSMPGASQPAEHCCRLGG